MGRKSATRNRPVTAHPEMRPPLPNAGNMARM